MSKDGENIVDVEGGDAACWAHLLCAQCGKVLEPDDRAAEADDDDRLCRECAGSSS